MDNIYQIKFEQNLINDIPGVDVYNHDFNALPNRDIKIGKLARRSLSIITSSEYSDKLIPAFAEVCSGSRSDTEATITQLKALLQTQNGELVGLQNGVEVQYTATLREMPIEWNGPTAYISMIFLASTPIGTATETLTFASFNTTVSQYSATSTLEGSATVEPITTVTINSVMGGAAQTISIFNARTNQGITVSGTWAAADTMVINSYTRKVTVNGVDKDFTGIFPTFAAGEQQVQYNDTFTTRNVDVAIEYNPRYT
jgi:hypothetical protein